MTLQANAMTLQANTIVAPAATIADIAGRVNRIARPDGTDGWENCGRELRSTWTCDVEYD